jgi:hypothetical protein
MAKEKWKYGPGEIVRETFNEDYEILPQSEPIFDYSQIPVEAYSKLLKRTTEYFICGYNGKRRKT